MKIDDSLSLIIPLYREGGEPYAYVRSRPIAASAFDVHFRLLIRTFQAMMDEGAGVALRSANRFMKAAAQSMAPSPEAAEALYRPLLNEIERDGFHVLNQRISLTPIRTLWLAWKTYVRG